MTDDEKKRIAELRKSGIGYQKIATILGLNVNTVKTYCRRHGLMGDLPKEPEMVFPGVYRKICKQCGKYFLQYPGHREKLFCGGDCRTKWWNSHFSEVKRKTMNDYICPTCGRTFSAYENRHRKYCCHDCYIKARFGGDAGCA